MWYTIKFCQPKLSFLQGQTDDNAPLLPKLQGYFAKFLHLCSSIALVYSTYPPVLDFIYLKDFTY